MADPHNLQRFVDAQKPIFEQVLQELSDGQKATHWMWFVFPQVQGLGISATSRFYAIRSIAEARAYLAHPQLGPRLRQCAETLLALDGYSAQDIFGYVDASKLQSCMTLFARASGSQSPYQNVLDDYFDGQFDQSTLDRLSG